MKNTKKGLIVSAIVLGLTIGIFAIKNYILTGPEGLRLASPLDFLLGLPALPFLPLYIIFPNASTSTITTAILILTTIFWLSVGYGIGKWMDKKKK